MFTIIETNQAPKAIGPYSQAIKTDQFIFLSGQIPVDPKTNEIVQGDIVLQTKQVMTNIQSILEAEQLTLKHILKTTIYITDMGQSPIVNEEYEKCLRGHRPARSMVEVSGLPKGALVEIEAIAQR